MASYKVWLSIEVHPDNPARDPYNTDEPVDVAVFGTLREARRFVRKLVDNHTDAITRSDWIERGIYPYSPKEA